MQNEFFIKTLPALGVFVLLAGTLSVGLFVVGISEPPEKATQEVIHGKEPRVAEPPQPPPSRLPIEGIGDYSAFFESGRFLTISGKIVAAPVRDELQIQLPSGLVVTYTLDNATRYFLCRRSFLGGSSLLAAGWEVAVAYTRERNGVLNKAAAVEILTECPPLSQ